MALYPKIMCVIGKNKLGELLRYCFKEICLGGGIGRHCRLKICCPYGRAGSSPAPGTKPRLCGVFFYGVNPKIVVNIN